mgnify:CR=1 FL=1
MPFQLQNLSHAHSGSLTASQTQMESSKRNNPYNPEIKEYE